MATMYLAMTGFPRHIEERLLEYNIIQLCQLVSEKTGPRWSGASDQYGPIQEIERRWKLDELTQRISRMPPEPVRESYKNAILAAGGDPREEARKIDPKMGTPGYNKVLDKIASKTKPLEKDVVREGLEHCASLDDLKKVAQEQGLGALDWAKIDSLVNFGLKRMYVGNAWRTKIRRAAKGKT